MRVILFFILIMTSLFSHASHLSKEGEGLYLDVSFAPAWRNCRNNDPLASYTVPTSEGTAGFLRLVPPSVFKLNHGDEVYAPGIRAIADLSANRRGSVQGIFTGLYEWKIKKLAKPTNGTDIGVSINPYGQSSFGPQFQFESVKSFDVCYEEHFNSAETNYLRHLTPRFYDYFSFSWIAGVRGMRHDNMIEFTGTPNPLSGEPVVTKDCILYLKNINTFIGLQAGGIFRYRWGSRTYFDMPFKGGLYANIIESRVWIRHPFFNGTGYEERQVIDRNRYRTQPGYSFEVNPRFEVHIGYGYACFGVSYLYLHAVTPVARQIAGYDLDSAACAIFNLYGITLGAGFHL